MATHLDPELEFDSSATSMLPRLPPLEVQVRAAECEGEAEAEECKTPTSEEHRIPPALTCPAAPRKAKARTTPAVPCKRAPPPSDRLESFEVRSRGEVEGFFRSCEEAAKRRRFFCR
ncbi:hypothetical protein EUGRSUZ_G02732 [Eucalyptus grandis]|uniref:Cyclin-dependent protein kinase inhibitor n=2 Tax=Eucalyptus grandis TaxID=71139 RepID=A0A059BGU1_EUCGR|nr:hypothetical protein EUGRSUZ_G02732 [Eucalyptus grandis]